MKWNSVTKSAPCPICGKSDWCGVSEDGRFAICMRIQNDHPTKNGGFLYKWDGTAYVAVPPRSALPVRKGVQAAFEGAELRLKLPVRPAHFSVRLTAEQVEREIESDSDKTSWFDGLRSIAGAEEQEGVNAYCDLGIFLSKRFPYTLGFPMRDATGTAVGVRYRSSMDAKKWSLKGGSDGLFLPLSVMRSSGETVYITEGASDTLALSALGLPVIGRSSCSTGAGHIRDIFRSIRPSSCIIIGDREEVKQTRGVAYLPGMRGAKTLASLLKCPVKIAYPMFAKDIRDMILSMRKKGHTTTSIRDSVVRLARDANRV